MTDSAPDQQDTSEQHGRRQQHGPCQQHGPRQRTGGRTLPPPLHAANEGLAFLLELVMLGVLAWWGASAGSGLAASITLGIGTPLVAAVIWGLLAAPRAPIRLPMPGLLGVKAVVFAGAAVALWALGQHALAIAFAVVTMANATVAAIDRDAAMRSRAEP